MSQLLSVQSGMSISGGTTVFQWPTSTQQVTMNGTHVFTNTQDVPTTSAGQALVVGAGIATLGWALFLNLDPTNYVDVGLQVGGTFYPLLRLPPYVASKSPPAFLRLTPGITLYARAHTAICAVQYALIED